MLRSQTALGTNTDWKQSVWSCPGAVFLWSSSLLCWLHPSNPRNVTAKAFVAKAGRTPRVPWLKIGLKVGERSFGKGLVEPRWFHNGFIFRVYAHPNTNGSCCFSSPEHFTPVLSCRLSLFPCDWPLRFLWGYFYTPGNCHQEAYFPCQPLQLLFPSVSVSTGIYAVIEHEHTGETMRTSGEASMWMKANRPWQAQSLGNNLLLGVLPTPYHLWLVHELCLP